MTWNFIGRESLTLFSSLHQPCPSPFGSQQMAFFMPRALFSKSLISVCHPFPQPRPVIWQSPLQPSGLCIDLTSSQNHFSDCHQWWGIPVYVLAQIYFISLLPSIIGLTTEYCNWYSIYQSSFRVYIGWLNIY